MEDRQRFHASCVSLKGEGVLVTGPPGSGKSDLVLRLLGRGFDLVADDQVEIADGIAYAPPALAGLLEVRGVGIVRLPHVAQAKLALIVRLGDDAAPRMPTAEQDETHRLPVLRLDPKCVSAVDRVALVLDCAQGRVMQVVGAFAG
jgi:HPr kinase/phosphorylase